MDDNDSYNNNGIYNGKLRNDQITPFAFSILHSFKDRHKAEAKAVLT